MTLAQLIQWHTQRGIEAMKRAATATTVECREANERTQTAHRETVEQLTKLSA